MQAHQEKVRNEGLSVKPYLNNNIKITLELDDEGSSKTFEKEGATTVQDDSEFKKLGAQLKESRA